MRRYGKRLYLLFAVAVAIFLCITVDPRPGFFVYVKEGEQPNAGLQIATIVYGERVVQVGRSPQDSRWRTRDGYFIHPGFVYRQIRILWFPIYSFDGRWCGALDVEEKYLDLDFEDLSKSMARLGLAMPIAPPVSEVHYGNLLRVFLIAMLGVIYFRIPDPPPQTEESQGWFRPET